MKKFSAFSMVALTLLFTATSCKKEPVSVTKTINVELKSNDTYSYTIPHAGDADDMMQIVQQAVNYSVSKITADASGNTLFEYVPAKDFSGTDEVRISNVEEHHDSYHGGGNHGNCNGGKHGHDDSYTYIFRINISKTL